MKTIIQKLINLAKLIWRRFVDNIFFGIIYFAAAYVSLYFFRDNALSAAQIFFILFLLWLVMSDLRDYLKNESDGDGQDTSNPMSTTI